jgi:hypothetical protein
MHAIVDSLTFSSAARARPLRVPPVRPALRASDSPRPRVRRAIYARADTHLQFHARRALFARRPVCRLPHSATRAPTAMRPASLRRRPRVRLAACVRAARCLPRRARPGRYCGFRCTIRPLRVALESHVQWRFPLKSTIPISHGFVFATFLL